MVAPLNEIVGLPAESSPTELDDACERRCKAVRDPAARGDANAQRELLRLRIAFLNWAYSGKNARRQGVRSDSRRP
ncbi:MAG: hypothetical protein K9K30_01855 [Burkholderiaceae bacterium]|nr:hypothetical protein [Sulfuritalea sp.]MCF8173961.1 hypothetical protein [Burkholderiaceae bacterium]